MFDKSHQTFGMTWLGCFIQLTGIYSQCCSIALPLSQNGGICCSKSSPGINMKTSKNGLSLG